MLLRTASLCHSGIDERITGRWLDVRWLASSGHYSATDDFRGWQLYIFSTGVSWQPPSQVPRTEDTQWQPDPTDRVVQLEDGSGGVARNSGGLLFLLPSQATDAGKTRPCAPSRQFPPPMRCSIVQEIVSWPPWWLWKILRSVLRFLPVDGRTSRPSGG